MCQSLRAKTEKTLVRDAVEEAGSRLATKQIFSFALSDKVFVKSDESLSILPKLKPANNSVSLQGAFVREIILEEMVKVSICFLQ